MQLGTNLSFSVKRWVEPEAWARVVRREFGLDLVQFSFDLIDPWWPAELRAPLAARVRKACAAEGITLHSAFVGLAHYTYNQLLHPAAEGRQAAMLWFRNAIDLAADMGADGVGGPLGAVSADEAEDDAAMAARYTRLLDDIAALTDYAKQRGLAAFYIEPTPLTREFPWTVDGANRMLADLAGRTAVPVKWCFDWGHAIYEPLYGKEGAQVRPWLEGCRDDIGVIHLQQSDGQLDRHWGFTHDDGIVVPHEAADLLRQTGLAHAPVFLECFYPFEWTNEQVMADMKASFEALKPAFAN